ncbi:Doubled CXXCH motif (Paired_CXXCH_1) [Thalassoglobus neptunius]|uniref:Doubled CXXCH motif (Paired_CXXCH_1) n=1 Tax=Thalassoglobus neptunius TaxID=1938619 RepID=A0A5C5WIY3_9PLAN|nr:cytochrome c3 family protein [Thalassoglobus neptunius]TWT50089.1 Doubled CXXCH motif (Paired_CXXCH_1) [Thalassoglobus neptunius]
MNSHQSQKHTSRFDQIRLATMIFLGATCGAFLASCGQKAPEEVPVPVSDDEDREEDVVVILDSKGFVGHEKCRECHEGIHEIETNSPHARTFARTGEPQILDLMCGRTVEERQPYGTYEYSCDDEGLLVALPARFPERAFPLDFAVGSGGHALTFLTLLKNKEGETIGIEHRMTRYSSDDALDATPGQDDLDPVLDVNLWGRTIPPEDVQRCIACHTTTATIEGNQLTQLTSGIFCERCHGPGEAHVRAAEDGNEALTLSSIRSGWTADEEIRMCGECHRLPDDIAPERLEAYPNSLVRFQPVGLLKSACFLESGRTLSCTSCHDPHAPVSSRTKAQQIETCLSCHQEHEQTICPVSPKTNCIECHMPAMDLTRGIEFHDHWIRVRDPDEPRGTGNVPHHVNP